MGTPGQFAAQTKDFSVTWDATPSVAPADVVMGLSNGATQDFKAMACIVRFADSGNIDARNGGGYDASSKLTYKAGTAYFFRMVVRMSNKTYDVYVKPAGETQVVLASNFAFRTEQSGVTQLNWLNKIKVQEDSDFVNMSSPQPVIGPPTTDVPVPPDPVPPDPTGWDDGTDRAPSGTPQLPHALDNYPPGHGRRDKNVANQPPFNVPGVDYRVGIQTGVTLKAPSASNMPAGASFSGGNITVNGTSGVVLDGFDMGNGQITVNSKSGSVTIRNCKWNLTSGHDPIYFYQTKVTGLIQYCEMYCNGQNTPNGFVGWTITASDAGGSYTVEYCYLEKAYADGFDWRGSAGGSLTLQYNCLYDTGNGIGAGAHPDFIQIQSAGPQKIWNNFGFNPNYGSQGFGAWDVAFPAQTCQNVSITTGGNAYSINTGNSSFSTTNKFVFHHNYVDNKGKGSMLYPGYDKTKSDVKENIQLANGQTFS
jgi:hypothetical protein